MIRELTDICANCGKRAGLHNAMTDQCPKKVGLRPIYLKTTFKAKPPRSKQRRYVNGGSDG